MAGPTRVEAENALAAQRELAQSTRKLAKTQELLTRAEEAQIDLEERRSNAAARIQNEGPSARASDRLWTAEMNVRRARGLAPPRQPEAGGPVRPIAEQYRQELRSRQQAVLEAKIASPRREPDLGLGERTSPTASNLTDARRAELRARLPIMGQAGSAIDMGSAGRLPSASVGTVEEMEMRARLRARMPINEQTPAAVDMGRATPAETAEQARARKQATLDERLRKPSAPLDLSVGPAGPSSGGSEVEKRRAELRARMGIGGAAPVPVNMTPPPFQPTVRQLAARRAADEANKKAALGDEFHYEGMDVRGGSVSGKVRARDRKHAEELIAAKGHFVEQLSKIDGGDGQKKPSAQSGKGGGKGGGSDGEGGILNMLRYRGMHTVLGAHLGPMAQMGGLFGAGTAGGAGMAGAGAATTGMAMATGAMSHTAKAMEVLGNSTMTAAQKSDELARSLPVVGNLVAAFIELREAVKGTAEGMRQSKLAEPKLRLKQEEQHALAMLKGRMAHPGRTITDFGDRAEPGTTMGHEVSGHFRRAAALRGIAATPIQAPLMPVGQGYQAQLAYQEKAILHQPEVERQRAGAELEAAKKTEEDAAQRLKDLEAQGEGLKKRATLMGELATRERKAEGEPSEGAPTATVAGMQAAAGSRTKRFSQWLGETIGGSATGLARRVGINTRNKGDAANVLPTPRQVLGLDPAAERNKVGREVAGKQEQEALNAVLLNRQQIQQAITQQQEASVSVAQKESDVRKADLAIAKSKLEVLKQQIQTISAQATRVGGMSEIDKSLGLAAARHVKRHGLRATPMEMRQRAAQFAPEWLQKEQERAGLEDPATKAAKAEGFFQEGDAVKKAIEAQKIQTEVQVKISLDEAALSDRIVAALARSFEKLVANIKSEFNARLAHMEAGQGRGQNDRGNGR